MKPVVWTAPALRDAADAAHWYAGQGGLALGDRFLSEVEAALDYVGRHPKAGSTRYAVPLQWVDLRVWPVKRFPYLLFYVEHETHIDVGRVLHAQRDIPAWMRHTENKEP